MSKLEDLRFDNLSLRALPLDPEQRNFVRDGVANACFSLVQPTPLDAPELACACTDVLELLGIAPAEAAREDFARFMCGNEVLPGARPAAHCYCGHQFGYFSGQLGDGATMYLGEVINHKGERWEVQFKGAGKTPYSRSADGRKVLRSSLREFLCSEANFNLGIPTTRAASIVTSASVVPRDRKYDGNVELEKCAVVVRVAKSFLRFGSFEIFKPRDAVTGRAGPSAGNVDLLRRMLDHVCTTFYPECKQQHDLQQDQWAAMFREVVERTARMVAKWQCFGFCHGVLNTDNMSVLGVTIDYGPFGFMEYFDKGFVCNASDDSGRYAYNKQPEICKWNCTKLGEAISPALPREVWEPLVACFDEAFDKEYARVMRRKLGLLAVLEGDDELIAALFDTMHATQADFTTTFLNLARGLDSDPAPFVSCCCSLETLVTLLRQKQTALRPRIPAHMLELLIHLANTNPLQLAAMMGSSNVQGVVQEVRSMEAALRKIAELDLEIERAGQGDLNARRRDAWRGWLSRYRSRVARDEEAWAAGNCPGSWSAERAEVMRTSSPRVVLRNWVAQQAIEAAERGDFSVTHKLLRALQEPFDPPSHAAAGAGASSPPPSPSRPVSPFAEFEGAAGEDAASLCVS